jgi:aldose 1-epimerase
MSTLQLTNTRSGAIARIRPESGFNCYKFTVPVGGRPVDVLDSETGFETSGENASHSGIPILFPFPNRIRGAKFDWARRVYDLQVAKRDAQGNAIHGLVIDRPWRVAAQGENYAVGRFQLSVDAPDRGALWPADFLIEIRYELVEATLRCDIRVANPDKVPLPWGFGTHPYFRVPLAASSRPGQCLICAPAATMWELVDCLPTGRQVPVPGSKDLREGQALQGLKLDDAFTNLTAQNQRVETLVMDPQAGLQVTQTFDAAFRDLVVYTPPHGRSVCLEPYTCITDAVHLAARGIDAGWRTLAPGEEFRTWFEITAGQVIA